MYKKIALIILIAAPVLATVADELSRTRQATPPAAGKVADAPTRKAADAAPSPDLPIAAVMPAPGDPMAGADRPMVGVTGTDVTPPVVASASASPAPEAPGQQTSEISAYNPIPDAATIPGIRTSTYQPDG